MSKKTKGKEIYAFKKGQIKHLDSIYAIQGLCGGDWWDPVPDSSSWGGVATGEDATHCSGDTICINRDITIEITER